MGAKVTAVSGDLIVELLIGAVAIGAIWWILKGAKDTVAKVPDQFAQWAADSWLAGQESISNAASRLADSVVSAAEDVRALSPDRPTAPEPVRAMDVINGITAPGVGVIGAAASFYDYIVAKMTGAGSSAGRGASGSW